MITGGSDTKQTQFGSQKYEWDDTLTQNFHFVNTLNEILKEKMIHKF